MYQYSTFAPLASSKIYLKTIRECSEHLKKAVKMTNNWRKKREKSYISLSEIEIAQKLLKIDMEKENIMLLLGDAKDLTTENLDRPTPTVMNE
jgi:hypothetical protein